MTLTASTYSTFFGGLVPVLTVVCVALDLDGNVWLTFSRRKWLWSVCDEWVLLYLTC